ncbi:MAG: hypothetical protein D6736_18260 [Nitrospinota bacterium]|nr:MAG: hypothetical protein D6736_18260 [Nitrospinota bacterium]
MPLPLMYPAEVDRYRLIQKLVRQARATYHVAETGQRGIDQTALAIAARVSQATISNLENLEKAVTSRRRRVSREELIRVLTWGLELEQAWIDAILWLYDGEPLNEDEIRRYVRGYLPEAAPAKYTTTELRRLVLCLLQEALSAHDQSPRVQPVTVKLIFSGDERAILEADEALLQMERLPGQSLLVSEYPSHLTHPPEAHKSGELVGSRFITDALRQQWLSVNWKRVETFYHNLELYGQRSIHCKASVQRYLQRDFSHRLTLEQRRRQIAHWITLLESYDHYQVGLAETTPALELKLKGTVQAMMRSACRYEDDRWPHWGPRYVLWVDETSVFRFFLNFENAWDAIPPQDRDKEEVIRWLRTLLSHPG